MPHDLLGSLAKKLKLTPESNPTSDLTTDLESGTLGMQLAK